MVSCVWQRRWGTPGFPTQNKLSLPLKLCTLSYIVHTLYSFTPIPSPPPSLPCHPPSYLRNHGTPTLTQWFVCLCVCVCVYVYGCGRSSCLYQKCICMLCQQSCYNLIMLFPHIIHIYTQHTDMHVYTITLVNVCKSCTFSRVELRMYVAPARRAINHQIFFFVIVNIAYAPFRICLHTQSKVHV